MQRRDIHAEQRVRAIRVGYLSAGLVSLLMLATGAVPGPWTGDDGTSWTLVVGLLGLPILAALVPLHRLFPGPYGELVMAGFLVAATVLVSYGVALAGQATDLFWLYALLITFAAIVYRRRGQLLYLAVTLGAFGSAVTAAEGPVDPAGLVFRLGILCVTAFMAGHLASASRDTLDEQLRHNAELARQSELRKRLTRSTLAMTRTDRGAVLEAITRGALDLGFDAVSISTVVGDELEMLAAEGVLSRFVGARFPRQAGIGGAVLAAGDTVAITDYAAHPGAHPVFLELGCRSVVGVPLGDVDAGLLVAVRFEVAPPSQAQIESLELLAAQARAALEVVGAYGEKVRAVTELRRVEAMKTDFLSSVSHELRTPLTVILGLSTTLTEHWDRFEAANRRDLVERIQTQSSGLVGVVTSLLDFARLERGTLEPAPVRVDLSELVGQVVLRTGPLLERHRLSFDLDEATGVVADRNLIERVVENLLTNAARHTPPGTHVRVRVASRPSSVEVSVTDDGPGMAPDEAQRLGERFFRGAHARRNSASGMGLGMALATDILELHGSRLEVESAVGRGTSFRFSLDRAPADDTTLPHRIPAPEIEQTV